MKLSEKLKSWRAERPDEWTMDEFIRTAEKMELICDEWFVNPMVQPYAGANRECMFCGATADRSEAHHSIAHHSTADCPHLKYLDILK